MKLSEALRLGEFALPPAKGVWFARRLASGKVCGACAVGRAIYAAGYTPCEVTLSKRLASFNYYGRVEFNQEYAMISCFVGLTWPWTRRVNPRLPLWENALVASISNRYESGRATMQELAGFVEDFEAQYDPQPVTSDVTQSTNKEAVCQM